LKRWLETEERGVVVLECGEEGVEDKWEV